MRAGQSGPIGAWNQVEGDVAFEVGFLPLLDLRAGEALLFVLGPLFVRGARGSSR